MWVKLILILLLHYPVQQQGTSFGALIVPVNKMSLSAKEMSNLRKIVAKSSKFIVEKYLYFFSFGQLQSFIFGRQGHSGG